MKFKRVLPLIFLGLLMTLCMNAQYGGMVPDPSTGPPDNGGGNIDCSWVCQGTSGWDWIKCNAGCYLVKRYGVLDIPKSLQENPFFLAPCERERLKQLERPPVDNRPIAIAAD